MTEHTLGGLMLALPLIAVVTYTFIRDWRAAAITWSVTIGLMVYIFAALTLLTGAQ